ncbi:DNA-binding protein [Motiliproteus sp. MSK22-1]|nr:DNA-binding protein [Motiliproteus sp. MSK22-1]
MQTAKFFVGQLIHHRLFDYRGVIVDVDPSFMLSEEWYQQIAKSRPAKDQPWYRVLVHNAIHETYVAESNLELDTENEPISHPEVANFFDAFVDGHYVMNIQTN